MEIYKKAALGIYIPFIVTKWKLVVFIYRELTSTTILKLDVNGDNHSLQTMITSVHTLKYK